MGLKKEEEDNGNSKETSDSNYDGPCHGSITVKKEEDENEDQQNSTNTPYTILSTTMVPDQAISSSSSSSNLNSSSRSGETENYCSTKNNDDDDDDDDRFKKWESGNWCWLDDHKGNDVKDQEKEEKEEEENLNNSTTGCDIDTRVKKEEKADDSSSFDTTTSGNDADDDTGVKKEEEEEEDNDNSFDTNNGRNSNDDTEAKKEKGRDDDCSGFDTTNVSENNCIRTAVSVSDITSKGYSDHHGDWTTGNWCWEVLPNLNSDGRRAVGLATSVTAAITSTVAVSTSTKNKRKLEQSQDNHKKKSRTIVQNTDGIYNADSDAGENNDDDIYNNADNDDNDESEWNFDNSNNHSTNQWNTIYERLVVYKKEHNTTSIPCKYKEDPPLGLWVHAQRQKYKNKSLSVERVVRLTSIDFVWDPFDAQWLKMYQRLVAYKEQYKSTCVPKSYKADPQLVLWVVKQRTNYNTNMPRLTTERKHQLNSISFVWNALDARWTEMYDRLVAYKNKYKRTCVPRSYKDDPQLARWVYLQRGNYNSNRSCLTTDRIKQLNSIGFIWNAQK